VIRSAAFAADREGLVDLMASRYLVQYELANVIEPDSARLRRSPSTVARLLLSLAATPHGGLSMLDEPLDNDEVVSIVLDGLLIQPPPTTALERTVADPAP
jgi:hypothetical protein